jgi:hypothetical protein
VAPTHKVIQPATSLSLFPLMLLERRIPEWVKPVIDERLLGGFVPMLITSLCSLWYPGPESCTI